MHQFPLSVLSCCVYTHRCAQRAKVCLAQVVAAVVSTHALPAKPVHTDPSSNPLGSSIGKIYFTLCEAFMYMKTACSSQVRREVSWGEKWGFFKVGSQNPSLERYWMWALPGIIFCLAILLVPILLPTYELLLHIKSTMRLCPFAPKERET